MASSNAERGVASIRARRAPRCAGASASFLPSELSALCVFRAEVLDPEPGHRAVTREEGWAVAAA